MIDQKDRKIISSALADPTITVKALAAKVSMPEATVQKRLSSLIAKGLLQRGLGVVNWTELGFPLRYRIDLKVNPHDLMNSKAASAPTHADAQKRLAKFIVTKLAKSYSESLAGADVTILMGSTADLCITLRARSHEDIFFFVTNDLRTIPGVESTVTLQEAWSILDDRE